MYTLLVWKGEKARQKAKALALQEEKQAGAWEMKHLQTEAAELRNVPTFYVLLLLQFFLLRCNKRSQILVQIRLLAFYWLRNYLFKD